MLKMVEKGELFLEDTVASLLPELPLHNSYDSSPSLAMMLEHTAGLADLSAREFNYLKPLSLQKAFAVNPKAKKVLWEPGCHYSYSNAGAGYVAAAIEKKTGVDYDLWFAREILKPLGMTQSQLYWSEEIQSRLVQGYDTDLRKPIPYWHTLFRAFGGLNSTPNEMARFLSLLVNKGELDGKRVFSSASIDRMESPLTSLSAKNGIVLAYGLGLRSEAIRGHKVFSHGGDADGYLAHFAYSHESGRGYFVVINAFNHRILDQFQGFL
ncbi:unnamed protein product, partial [marine sediment metagenome]